MSKNDKIIADMRNNPGDVRYEIACRIAEDFFGYPRRNGSHAFYSVPWPGKPWVNFQEGKNGKAKKYQILQLLEAIDRMDHIRKDHEKE
jgi:hypothetical protein